MSGATDPDFGNCALIMIDVERDTLDGAPFEIPGTSEILPRLQRLAKTFRSRGAPIIHVVRIYRRDGSNVEACRRELVQQGASLLIAGSEGSQIADGLLPTPHRRLDPERLLRDGVQEVGPQTALGRFFRDCFGISPSRPGRFHVGVQRLQLPELPSNVDLRGQ